MAVSSYQLTTEFKYSILSSRELRATERGTLLVFALPLSDINFNMNDARRSIRLLFIDNDRTAVSIAGFSSE